MVKLNYIIFHYLFLWNSCPGALKILGNKDLLEHDFPKTRYVVLGLQVLKGLVIGSMFSIYSMIMIKKDNP